MGYRSSVISSKNSSSDSNNTNRISGRAIYSSQSSSRHSQYSTGCIRGGGGPLWTVADGWDHRPRPQTSPSYRSLGHYTCANGRWRLGGSGSSGSTSSSSGSNNRAVPEHDHHHHRNKHRLHHHHLTTMSTTSTFSSTTGRYTPLQCSTDSLTTVPPKDPSQSSSSSDERRMKSPGYIYECSTFPPVEWPHRSYLRDKGLGGTSTRFADGLSTSFIPTTCGSGKLLMPCENQVGGGGSHFV